MNEIMIRLYLIFPIRVWVEVHLFLSLQLPHQTVEVDMGLSRMLLVSVR